jgi:hypothetical protein
MVQVMRGPRAGRLGFVLRTRPFAPRHDDPVSESHSGAALGEGDDDDLWVRTHSGKEFHVGFPFWILFLASWGGRGK